MMIITTVVIACQQSVAHGSVRTTRGCGSAAQHITSQGTQELCPTPLWELAWRIASKTVVALCRILAAVSPIP
jgi:hypothetical protein